jgi:hypothetical protein
LLTNWKNSLKTFNITKKKKENPAWKCTGNKRAGKKFKENQIRSDQEQLNFFEKEQEIQLMMNNTYNKKPKWAKK